MTKDSQEKPSWLSFTRRRASEREREPLEEALSDRARIIAASSFRRLQTKAQVFSLERNAAVRSRLTHTLEVAMYGELIAYKVASGLDSSSTLLPPADGVLVVLVGNACMLHDIGNPPFGHLGEYAVQDWISRRSGEIAELFRSSSVPESLASSTLDSYRDFDGNAQALRIVTSLQWLEDEYGLNLTASLIASILKYPTPRKGDGPFRKKVGYFPTEKESVEFAYERTGLSMGRRHPLVYLMESADDIAYCVSDIEDALEKNVVSASLVAQELQRSQFGLWDYWPKDSNVRRCSNGDFIKFRVNWTRAMVDRAAEQFLANQEKLLAGEFNTPLLEADPHCFGQIDALKTFARRHVFRSKEAVRVELAGFRVIQNLLDHLFILLKLSHSDFAACCDGEKASRQFPLESRLCTLLPGKHRLWYRHATECNPSAELLFRFQLIIDYVAGMTDVHALQVFRTLNASNDGIEP